MEHHPLHLKNPELQKSNAVGDAVEKEERLTGEDIPNDPTERIDAYMDRLENVFLHPDARVRERNIEMLREKIYDAYIIKPEDFPESYFELQQRIARERGQAVEEIPQEVRQQMIETAIEDQRHSLDQWIDYLSSPDAVYPSWFKYYAWTQVTKLSQFDKERGEFKKRTKSTVAPFPDIYREPLAQIADLYERVKDDNKDSEARAEFDKKFPSLYAELIQRSLASQLEGKETIEGEWVRYRQGESDDVEALYQSLEGKGTGWCTAGHSTAETQIESGDFYVYYTDDAQHIPHPRLAIRMDGTERIAEVRGILPHQGVEPLLQDILDQKLASFGPEADRYKKKSEDMKRLTLLTQKHEKGDPFTKDDLRFLYEIDSLIEGFGYDKDPRIAEVISTRDPKTDLASVFDCTPEEISLTEEEALEGHKVFHCGDLYLASLRSAEGLTLPQSISGSINLGSLRSAKGLTLPQSIDGSLELGLLTSAEGLTLPQSIGGSLYLRSLKSAEGLTLPQSIGGSLYLQSLAKVEKEALKRSHPTLQIY